MATASPPELNLKPLAEACFVSGQALAAGDRVVSYLVRGDGPEGFFRYDLLESHSLGFVPAGAVVCRWVQVCRPRPKDGDSERALKLTAESLFLTLADPANELSPENTRLVRFLAVLLERKRILRRKGRSADGVSNLFEHGGTRQVFAVPAGELTREFFIAIQEQLGALGMGAARG